MTPSPWLLIFADLTVTSRREKVCETVRRAIHQGFLISGQKMPSTRQLAIDLGLSRVTTEAAYAQLESEGWITRQQGKGSFVSTQARPVPRIAPRGLPRRQLSSRGRQILATGGCHDPRHPLPFAAGSPDLREFPLAEWQKISASVLRTRGTALMGYGDPQGLSDLRAALSAYLGLSRQIQCTPQQIVILSSSQQGLQLLSQLLLDPGDSVLVEEVCYPGAVNAFLAAGAHLCPLQLDEQGAIISDTPARLVYLTPAHQYPLGMSLSQARRRAWLDWAQKTNSWIIEDDYDGEFHYQADPLPALQSGDRHERVITLGTFSKTLFPSLRLAWMVVPQALTDSVVKARTLMDGHSPQLPQAVTAAFIQSGQFAQHLRRMRALYASRCRLLTEELQRLTAQPLRILPASGGLQLTVELFVGEESLLTRRAAEQGLILPPVSPLCVTEPKIMGWILGFSALQRSEILTACQALAALFR
ncbi:PLP-dependent aminotransferase family protein [Tatumella saanichensis]|uniref:MocR-like pyridoxine biosynthesis transcription factor PdxR n=1 Tax=Tatumella saanichensis TaxID=480813 RepID=UPI0004A3A6F1|nr:PLP-dependent aminotransferase family protein [Tatumella saanichensis]